MKLISLASSVIMAVFVSNSALSSSMQSTNELLQEAQVLQNQGEYQRAFEAYQMLADKGVDIAQFTLGFLFEQGLGTNKSKLMACKYYKKAAIQHVPLALEKTGDCYRDGVIAIETNKSYAEVDHTKSNLPVSNTHLSSAQTHAIDYYLQANESGIFSSGCKAGQILLEYGNDTEKKVGINYCEQTVMKGSVPASYLLGKWFLDGQHVPQNLAKSQAYLEMAKPKENPNAAFALGKLYDVYAQQHNDNQQTVKVAVYWYETAASQGYTQAYLPTSLLYWKLAQSNEKPEYLAKSYLWINTLALVTNTEDNTIADFTQSVNAAIPEDWKSTLDAKIHIHKQTFMLIKAMLIQT